MYVCVCAFVCVCTSMHVPAWLHVYMYRCVYVCVCRICVCSCVTVWVSVFVCVSTWTIHHSSWGSKYLQAVDIETGNTTKHPPKETRKKKKSKVHHWFSHDGIGGWLIQSIHVAVLKSVKYFISINFVLSLISMMVGNMYRCRVGIFLYNMKGLHFPQRIPLNNQPS